MKKKLKIALSILVLILLVVLFQLAYSYKNINKSLINKKIYGQSEKVQKAFKNYNIVECRFDLLNPEYAFVSYQHYVYPERNVDNKLWRIDFYNLDRDNKITTNWNIERTGGTTIKNTTFEELVKMAKEDCSQFQKAKGDFRDETINWSYSKYNPEHVIEPEKPLTEEEKEDLTERRKKKLQELMKKDIKRIKTDDMI